MYVQRCNIRKVLYSSLLLLFYTQHVYIYIYIIDSRGRNGGGVQKMYPLYILYYIILQYIYIYIIRRRPIIIYIHASYIELN